MTLAERVQHLADEPIKGFPQRRRGMRPEVAQRIIAEVVAEALAIVEPFALNAWGGDTILRRLRALAAPPLNAGRKNGSRAGSDPHSTNGGNCGDS